MNAILLVTTICSYILSVVVSLLLGMISKRLNPNGLRIGLALHGSFVALTVLALLSGFPTGTTGPLMLVAVCSGLALSGWGLRNTLLPLPLRVYLGSFLLSIAVFIWSPSLLFYTISGHFEEYRPEHQVHLRGNHFLVEQQSMLQGTPGEGGYKVIRKFGIYNKTLTRDLHPRAIPRSASLTELGPDSLRIDLSYDDGSSESIQFRSGMKRNRIERRTKAAR
ncbi:MAG: hypothetical protein LW707_10710 [Sphingobacteriales bacterium]|jgi:hypothetical protein|nr:hypothetical protein [Sphingobacteriales bacterium]